LYAVCVLAIAAAAVSETALGQESSESGVSRLDPIQVTATYLGERVAEVPNVVVITQEDLRARGVNDLRSALALIGGITVAPGGDGGPADASPGMRGKRESDDFLLLIDGVPAGGAFIPQYAQLNLHNVERIEVIRGPAPVYYGTTAFAGTISVLHYAAGSTPNQAQVSIGSFGSFNVSAAGTLSDGPVKQSLNGDLTRDKLSDPRAGFDRANLLYRLLADWAGGQARLDVNASAINQKPTSPTPILDGALTNVIAPDFNQNPGDAKIDTRGARLTAGYDRALGTAQWQTLLSVTHSHTDLVQGFLADGFTGGVGDADGFSQGRSLTELFFDTHLTQALSKSTRLTLGVNELYGRAELDSRTFSYDVPLDGSTPPSSVGLPTDDTAFLNDRRSFFGIYAQAQWVPVPDFSILAGLRWNYTSESLTSGGSDAATVNNKNSIPRFSGSIGANWRIWKDPNGRDGLAAYVNLGNTFQPAQIDFGPEPDTEPILAPETARSIEIGLKQEALEGHLEVDLAAFAVDFGHQVTATDINGKPGLATNGSERLIGFEIETHYRPTEELTLTANYSYNDARFRNFTTTDADGDPIQLSGNHEVLSPQNLAALGVIYGAAQGFQGSLTMSYVGKRYLDMQNQIVAPGFWTTNASLGYGFKDWTLSVSGYNLSNRRDPVLESELGQAQIYRLPGRRVFLNLYVKFR